MCLYVYELLAIKTSGPKTSDIFGLPYVLLQSQITNVLPGLFAKLKRGMHFPLFRNERFALDEMF